MDKPALNHETAQDLDDVEVWPSLRPPPEEPSKPRGDNLISGMEPLDNWGIPRITLCPDDEL